MAQHITVGGLGATIVGTPSHVADEFERWVREADVDGFNLVRRQKPTSSLLQYLMLTDFQAYAINPGSFEDIIELLIPELQARGLFWDDYAVPGGTYRENLYRIPGQTGLLPEHPASSYRWKAE